MFGFGKTTPPKAKRTSSFVKTGGDSTSTTSSSNEASAITEKRELTRTSRGLIIKDNKPNSVAEVRRIVRNTAPKVEHFRFVKFRVGYTNNQLGSPYFIETSVRLLNGEVVHYKGLIKDFEHFIGSTQQKNHQLWLDATEEATEEEATIEEVDSEKEEDEEV